MRSHPRGRAVAAIAIVVIFVMAIAVSAANPSGPDIDPPSGDRAASAGVKPADTACAGLGLFLRHYDTAVAAIGQRRWAEGASVPDILDGAASILAVVDDLARTASDIGLQPMADRVNALGGRYQQMVFASGRFEVAATEVLIDQEASALGADIEVVRLGHRILGCRAVHPRRSVRR